MSDTGPGISPELRARLFQPFQQGELAATKGGTGLGLAITKRLVELMRGRLGVESVPGRGAGFWFEVPVGLVAGEEVEGWRVGGREGSEDGTGGWRPRLKAGGPEAIGVVRRQVPDIVFLDIRMPGMDGFETCRRLKEIEALLRVETHLRLRQLTRQLREQNAALAAEMERRNRAERERDASNARWTVLRQRDAERWGVSGLVGQSRTFRQILETARKAAGFGASPVLILGESGTGKELVARAIHEAGPHGEGPFLPVNCSAIPGELAESLLFGHVKGAFTGALAERPGYFELAHGGTLFLDEISELPLTLQPKLLRVLEDKEVTPVGAGGAHPVRTNIIAASNANFTERIARGQFRADLYFRLARFTVEVPPLRERQDDIPLLAHHFVQALAREMNLAPPPISNAALQALGRHDYPGNVRELKNLIERALMESEGQELRPEHLQFLGLPALFAGQPAASAGGAVEGGHSGDSEEERILGYVRRQGAITNTQARELLGVDRNHAGYVLHKLLERGTLVGEGQGRWMRYRSPP